MRLSFVLAAPFLLLACGQSFSAGGGGADASTSGDGGSSSGADTGTANDGPAVEASSDACGAVPSCPQLGWACGVGMDGCGRTVDCGDCTGANETCDPTSHMCKCHPLTCADFKAECGNVPDGCGNTLMCGTCEAGATCGGGGTLQCGTGPCVPATCASMNAQCGSIEDGCGNVVQCPDTCVAPQTCDGSGNMNQCGCTGQTCTGLGWACGSGDNGCGTTINCGTCDGGTCDPNAHSCTCAPQKTCMTQGWGCGSFTDSCNAVETCGPAPTEVTLTTVCTNTSYPHFYACCQPNGVAPQGGGAAEAGAGDGGMCNPNGPSPPEPGWSCIPTSTLKGPGWCCAQ